MRHCESVTLASQFPAPPICAQRCAQAHTEYQARRIRGGGRLARVVDSQCYCALVIGALTAATSPSRSGSPTGRRTVAVVSTHHPYRRSSLGARLPARGAGLQSPPASRGAHAQRTSGAPRVLPDEKTRDGSGNSRKRKLSFFLTRNIRTRRTLCTLRIVRTIVRDRYEGRT